MVHCFFLTISSGLCFRTVRVVSIRQHSARSQRRAAQTFRFPTFGQSEWSASGSIQLGHNGEPHKHTGFRLSDSLSGQHQAALSSVTTESRTNIQVSDFRTVRVVSIRQHSAWSQRRAAQTFRFPTFGQSEWSASGSTQLGHNGEPHKHTGFRLEIHQAILLHKVFTTDRILMIAIYISCKFSSLHCYETKYFSDLYFLTSICDKIRMKITARSSKKIKIVIVAKLQIVRLVAFIEI